MEPSRDLASAREREFNGSESGWTSYIGSCIYSEIYIDDEQNMHMEDYSYQNAHGKVDEKGENNNKDGGDEESDNDSMASDASSGPSQFQLVCINNEGSNGLVYKKQKDNDYEKIFSSKKASKQVRKTKYEYKVEKEEENSVLLIADSAASHV
ncbi:unnamed protein product [Lupinus luteus]|uniref:Uncharacterized protein n=1 Tax=Lupinus luteus TaxID=3873 RepID=A0AAV1X2Q3_LUPLU